MRQRNRIGIDLCSPNTKGFLHGKRMEDVILVKLPLSARGLFLPARDFIAISFLGNAWSRQFSTSYCHQNGYHSRFKSYSSIASASSSSISSFESSADSQAPSSAPVSVSFSASSGGPRL
jgi:hypothetical protein